ncbi:MAG: Mth938-like domain-containing protein [Burkholderiales bacterium]
MKLHASPAADRNVFTAYGEGFVAVNGVRREASLVVLPERVLDWPVASFEALAAGHFEQLAALGVELVLLGTGPRLRFPAPALTAPLARAGIGLEVMDVRAACRTFNILAAEERVVAAALVLG